MSKHDNRKALGNGDWGYGDKRPLTMSPKENDRRKARPKPSYKEGSLSEGYAFSAPCCDGEPYDY
jgi:hypothetical protein